MDNAVQSAAFRYISMRQDFACVLEDEGLLDYTSYMFLQNQSHSRFVPCARIRRNGKTTLVYLSSSYKSLLSLLPLIQEDVFVNILENLFGALLEAKGNGFLSLQNIPVSLDKVFVDISTNEVYLLYLPINVPVSETAALAMENALRANLLTAIRTNPSLSGKTIRKITESLSNAAMDIERIYAAIPGRAPAAAAFASPKKSRKAQSPIKLLSIEHANRIEFTIQDEEFVIGTAEGSVDGLIPFNRAVSSIHCKIAFHGGSYYIMDTGRSGRGSTNGTFLNGKRLPPNQFFTIQKNDVIKIADVKFAVQF